MSDPGQPANAGHLKETNETASAWLKRDGVVALATVVGTWGSAPVPVGGQMAISRDGSIHGSVSGGCVEGEVIAEAEKILDSGKAAQLTFGVADQTAWGAGLPCGGEIQVYLERIATGDAAVEMLDRVAEAQDRRYGLVVATNLSNGSRTIHVRGESGLDPEINRRFLTAKSDLVETEAGPMFYQAVVPPPRVVVIGATQIAQLVTQLARLAGYEIIIVDPRTAFASAERFPDVELHTNWPRDVLTTTGLDPYTGVVVVAHVNHIDDEALKIALASDAIYVGALGSRRNHQNRIGRLKDAGLDPDAIARIKCPIGLDIGAQSPAEIAIGIMAEVVRALRGAKYPDRAVEAGHDL